MSESGKEIGGARERERGRGRRRRRRRGRMYSSGHIIEGRRDKKSHRD